MVRKEERAVRQTMENRKRFEKRKEKGSTRKKNIPAEKKKH